MSQFDVDKFAESEAYEHYLQDIESDGPTTDYRCVRCGRGHNPRGVGGGGGMWKSGKFVCGECRSVKKWTRGKMSPKQRLFVKQARESTGHCIRCGGLNTGTFKMCSVCLTKKREYRRRVNGHGI